MININTDLIIIDEKSIKDKIYNIRGKQVMIDSDLAEIYGYLVKDFNRQVKNNIERFDDDFMFQLTKEEYSYILRCKNFTSSMGYSYGGRRYLPYVFTEEGIYMLMTVLKGELAIKQSKLLIRIFKSMKDYMIDNNILRQKYINNLVLEHDNKINELFNKLKPELKNKIFFKGQTYDAYSFLLDILNSSKEEVIIIDNCADKRVLDLISKIKTNVIIISKNMNEELAGKYQSKYNNLTIKQSDEFHDRFIIIDRKVLYHLGASLKDIGKSCFCINKIVDENILNSLIEKF